MKELVLNPAKSENEKIEAVFEVAEIPQPPVVQAGQKCLSHKTKPILAFNNKTQAVLCEKCISTQHLTKHNYTVYTNIVTHLKENIDSTRKIIRHKKFQLQQSLAYLKNQHKDNKRTAVSALNDHFDRIQKLINDYRMLREQELMEMISD